MSSLRDYLLALSHISSQFDDFVISRDMRGIKRSISKYNDIYNLILENKSISDNEKVKYLLLVRELLSVMTDIHNKLRTKRNTTLPTILLFYRYSCNEVVKFFPIWNQLRSKYELQINFLEIDVNNEKYKQLVKEFNIIEYPTVKFVKDDLTHYDGKLTLDDLSIYIDRYLRV